MMKTQIRLVILVALILLGGGLYYFNDMLKTASFDQSEELRGRELSKSEQEKNQEQLETIAKLESQAKAEPTPPPEPNLPNPEDIAELEFKTYTQGVINEMPRLEDLRELPPEELHGTPKVIREAAIQMGVVADMVAKNPALKAPALEFYQTCSLQMDFPTPVRALCLNRALRLYAELHQGVWEFDRSRISPEVLELSKRL